MLKIHIKVRGGAKFELVFLIKSRKRALQNGYRVDQMVYRERKRGKQLMFVNRLDKYEGPCENLAVKHNVPAKLCMCKEQLLI